MTERMFPSAESVLNELAQWRNRGCALTNFYPNPLRVGEWCGDASLSGVACDGTLFVIRNVGPHRSLWFLSESEDALKRDVATLLVSGMGGDPYITDLLGMDTMRESLDKIFHDVGFADLAVLQRMSRRAPNTVYTMASSVRLASAQEMVLVSQALHEGFDPRVDQLPSECELESLRTNGGAMVALGEDGTLDGFVLFERSPVTLYLRYWWVSPKRRGLGVGSALLRSMFSAASGTKRQMLWVNTDNSTAIEKYRHYGFSFESLKDVIMIHGADRR